MTEDRPDDFLLRMHERSGLRHVVHRQKKSFHPFLPKGFAQIADAVHNSRGFLVFNAHHQNIVPLRPNMIYKVRRAMLSPALDLRSFDVFRLNANFQQVVDFLVNLLVECNYDHLHN